MADAAEWSDGFGLNPTGEEDEGNHDREAALNYVGAGEPAVKW